MRLLRSFVSVSGVLGVVWMAACSSKDEPTAPAAVNGVVLATQGVTFLDSTQTDDVLVVTGSLGFPKATHADIAGKKAGDVLVGDAGKSATSPNKWGFLRKVKSVTDDGTNYVVATEPASMVDIVDEADFQTTLTVDSLEPAPGYATKGGPIKLLDWSGKSIFSKTGSFEVSPGKTLGYEASLVLSKGTLSFTPSFDVGAKIKPALTLDIKKLLKEAHVIATGKLDAVAEVTGTFKLTGTATGADLAALIAKKVFDKPTTTLAEYPIKLPSFKLGPISAPAHANFKAELQCELAWGGETTVKVGATANVTVSAGAKYEDGKISPVFTHSESLNRTGPEFTITNDVGIRCSIVPTFELNLWDVAAGDITASAWAGAEALARCDGTSLTGEVAGKAYAGAKATAHAKLNVFGLYKWEKSCTLFDVRTPEYTVSGTVSLPKGSSCTPAASYTVFPPVAPSPDASCFGDTTVDPGSDAGTDGGILPDAGPVVCEHDVCTSGSRLTIGCTKDTQGGACIKGICENDPYCCEFAWTASCIDKVEKGMYGCTARKCTTP